jgi:hypothetical protein
VDGNFSLNGSILANGVGQLLWAPNDGTGNFSLGLGAMLSAVTGQNKTAVGDGTLFLDSTGINTAVGVEALSNNGCVTIGRVKKHSYGRIYIVKGFLGSRRREVA